MSEQEIAPEEKEPEERRPEEKEPEERRHEEKEHEERHLGGSLQVWLESKASEKAEGTIARKHPHMEDNQSLGY